MAGKPHAETRFFEIIVRLDRQQLKEVRRSGDMVIQSGRCYSDFPLIQVNDLHPPYSKSLRSVKVDCLVLTLSQNKFISERHPIGLYWRNLRKGRRYQYCVRRTAIAGTRMSCRGLRALQVGQRTHLQGRFHITFFPTAAIGFTLTIRRGFSIWSRLHLLP